MGLSGITSRHRHLMLPAILLWGGCVASSAWASDSGCAEALPDDLIAQEPFAGGVVAFLPLEGAGEGDREVQVAYYHPDEKCLPVTVDRYEINGGPPRLEASFVYPIQGEDNLFAIVSWPRLHRGLGINGNSYDVYAYQRTGTGLTLNTFVADNPAISSGLVGTFEGEELTFEGTTEDGLISLMASQGKWSWQAACDPSGTQHALTACAYVEQIEAKEELDSLRQQLAELYADEPDLQAEQLARFDEAQRIWQVQLKNDLDALFPLSAGEDPSFAYGSSYPMRHALAQAFLLRQRAEFLRTFWLDAR